MYQHLLARANYSVDDHSYLHLTNYLQNLSLIEESFNKNKHHGNSEPKQQQAHKKNNRHKSKLGSAQCRKHPHHEHTWADCWANPKNKNKNKNNKKDKSKAEARNIDTDSDADMDQALEVVNITEEEVSQLMNSKEPSEAKTHSNSSLSVPPVNQNNVFTGILKRSLVPNRNSSNNQNTSNKKRRLLNKKSVSFQCYMQTPLSRKLQKVDNTIVLWINYRGLSPSKKHYWSYAK